MLWNFSPFFVFPFSLFPSSSTQPGSARTAFVNLPLGCFSSLVLPFRACRFYSSDHSVASLFKLRKARSGCFSVDRPVIVSPLSRGCGDLQIAFKALSPPG
jgi:hypothetical protein